MENQQSTIFEKRDLTTGAILVALLFVGWIISTSQQEQKQAVVTETRIDREMQDKWKNMDVEATGGDLGGDLGSGMHECISLQVEAV